MKNKYSYDAWGRPRNADTWVLKPINTASALTNLNDMQPRFDRGYTGHEIMAGFGLINMNGRLYDPYLQRFLSPDNVVQDAANAQNYNRYSYCLNNPLRYNDPSGWKYIPPFIPAYDPWEDAINRSYQRITKKPQPGSMGFSSGSSGSSNSSVSLEDREFRDNATGKLVSFAEMTASYSKNNGIQINFINFGGTTGNPYANFQGVTLSNGTFVSAADIKNWGSNGGQGGKHSYIDYLNFSINAGDLYFSVKGEALHNELYWVQKNGTIRNTSSIGNNYLLRRSYNLTGQLAERAKITAKNFAYAGTAMSGINMVTDFRFANTFDFAMGLTTFLPGVGWAISGAYFITNVAVQSYTGKTIGEHLEMETNKIGQ